MDGEIGKWLYQQSDTVRHTRIVAGRVPGQPAQWVRLPAHLALMEAVLYKNAGRRATWKIGMITSVEVHPRPILALGLMLILLHLLGCPRRLLLERLSTCLLVTIS